MFRAHHEKLGYQNLMPFNTKMLSTSNICIICIMFWLDYSAASSCEPLKGGLSIACTGAVDYNFYLPTNYTQGKSKM